MPRAARVTTIGRTAAAALVVCLLAAPAGVAAQTATSLPPTLQPVPPQPGWTFTPSLGYGATWDDNALFLSRGDAVRSDFVNAIDPAARLGYEGRYSRFTAGYSGRFEAYRELSDLNAYEQQGSAGVRRRVSPRLTLFGSGSAAVAPTTELLELSRVPYLRVGSEVRTVGGGVEAAVARHTTATIGYTAQWISFERSHDLAPDLRDGWSQGADVAVRHRLSLRTTVTGDYDLTFATIGALDTFDLQNAWGGIEYRVTERLTVSGGFGVSHLGASAVTPGRTGPAIRAAVDRGFERASIGASYSRSFIPSYAFGGTQQNEELSARFQMAVGSRAYARTGLSWYRNQSLALTEPSLRSLGFDAGFGYALQRWARLETFYTTTRQNIDRPGGLADRQRFGVQIVTTQPLRIR